MATLDVANSPNDWPETYPQLRNLDTMLRCGICFEFMDTALILPQCSHNYCSLCIRRYIGYKPQCPACAKNIAQTDLKNNRIVDDIIKTFTELRSSLLKLVVSSRSQLTTDGHQTQATTKREEVVAFKTTTKQLRSPRLMQTNTAINASSRRCTKNAHSHSNDSIILDDSESSSDLPQQQRRSLEAHVLGEEVDIETDEDMFWSDDEWDRQLVRSKDSGCTPGKMGSDPANFPPNTNTISLSSDKMTSPTAVSSMSSMSSPSSSSMFAMHRSPVTRVDCPVCGVSIPDRHINMHLDQCLRAGPRLTTTTATASKAPLRKPLPKLVYNLMKDQQLKKRLADFRLPTQGDRQTLIRRHQDYTVMYNSQCDTLDPMTPGDIAKAVVENEKCKIKFRSTAPSSTQTFAAKKGDTVETVFQAQQKYVKQHKSQFSALLAQTRHRLQEQREKPEIQASAAHNTSSDTKCQLTENARKSDNRDATNYIIAKDAASSSEVALFAGDDIMSDSEDDSDHDIYHGSPQWSLCDGVTEILDGDIIDGEVKIQPNGCDDTDDGTDSDVTVDNSVPLVTEEQEEEGETKGDEINQDHADEAEEISPTENHRQEEPLDASDTDFEPMRKRRKRKTKASVSESPKGNSVVKKTKKNAEKTVAQDSNEPDATVKKPTGRQLRARRRNKDNGIGSNIDRSNVLKHT